jgi:hypothetical protein
MTWEKRVRQGFLKAAELQQIMTSSPHPLPLPRRGRGKEAKNRGAEGHRTPIFRVILLIENQPQSLYSMYDQADRPDKVRERI